MEGIIRVTAAELTNKANEFQNINERIRNLTNSMTSAIESLSGSWQGEAATAYQNKCRNLQEDMRKMYNMVKNHSENLIEMANVYSTEEEKNVQAAQSLPGNIFT